MSKQPQTVFGRRLRAARESRALPQDKLGALIGIDEGSSSARISRYETGTHEPPFPIAVSLARALKVPVAYFYCPEDDLAEILFKLDRLTRSKRAGALKAIQKVVESD